MNAIIKQCLKGFLLNGLPFGVAMTYKEMNSGREFELWSFLFYTLGFGLIMSIFYILHYRYKEDMKKMEIERAVMNQNIAIAE